MKVAALGVRLRLRAGSNDEIRLMEFGQSNSRGADLRGRFRRLVDL